LAELSQNFDQKFEKTFGLKEKGEQFWNYLLSFHFFVLNYLKSSTIKLMIRIEKHGLIILFTRVGR
jgi:hypothetical protein